MSQYTNLDYVQTILSSLDSDEVNNVDDTVESLQVLKILRTVYDDIQARLDLNEHYTLFELQSSGDVLQPVLMTRPADVTQIEWVQYDCIQDGFTDPDFRDMKFLPIDTFLKQADQLNTDDPEVDSFLFSSDGNNILFKFYNDRAPKYYTTFDDHNIVFDAYDAAVDVTLQNTKTRCYGKKDQDFQNTNAFVPFLDRDASTLLLNEAKVLAFAELKQMSHDVARQWAQRGWVKSQKSKRGIDNLREELDRAPNYARRR